MTNFDVVLVVVGLICTGIWLYDAWFAARTREATLRRALDKGDMSINIEQLAREPALVENAKFVLSLVVVLWLFRNFSSAINFGAVLVLLTLATGVTVLVDKLVWRPRRQARLEQARQQVPQEAWAAVDYLNREGGWVDFSRSVFPVILAILVIRSFLYEPFKIPSGSMKPTLEEGDFILVNKFAYGLRLPVVNTKFLDIGEPERGDIFVFRYPEDPSTDFIKRVIGLPGDRIVYRNKTLTIEPACRNGEPCPGPVKVQTRLLARGGYVDHDGSRWDIYEEDLMGVKHKILHHPFLDRPVPRTSCMTGPGEWVVPAGHYFAMGDNRENSRDSRYWCFVPEENLVGRADFIWMHFDTMDDSWFDFSRIGQLR
jgi:signal peptidase I